MIRTSPVADHICVKTVDVLFRSLGKAGVDAALDAFIAGIIHNGENGPQFQGEAVLEF